MEFWDEFQTLIDQLNHNQKTAVANSLIEARLLATGLTDGWYDFSDAFDKAIDKHKNEMDDTQLRLALRLSDWLKQRLRL